jgi:hypothetical protein
MKSFIILRFTKYYYGDQVKEDEMGGESSTHGEMRNGYKTVVEDTEVKGPLERLRCCLEDAITSDLTEIGLEVVNREHLAQDMDEWFSIVNTVMNLLTGGEFLD